MHGFNLDSDAVVTGSGQLATPFQPLPAKSTVSSRDGRATSVDVFPTFATSSRPPTNHKNRGQGVPAVFSQPRTHNGSGRSRPGAVAVSTGAGEVLVSQTRTRPVPFPSDRTPTNKVKVGVHHRRDGATQSIIKLVLLLTFRIYNTRHFNTLCIPH